MKEYIKEVAKLFSPEFIHVGLIWAGGLIVLLTRVINLIF